MQRIKITVVAGIAVALGVAALAYADGASDNGAEVEGSVKPAKLDRKKLKPVALFTEVRTEGPVTGTQANPETDYVEYDKDVAWRSNAAPRCTTPDLEVPGLTTQQARDLCPPRSYIGSGEVEVKLSETARVSVTVSVFNGPGKNEIRLHTSSQTLGAGAVTVFAEIVKSDSKKYGPVLLVPDEPDTGGDSFMITKFNSTIFRSSGVALASCPDGRFRIRRTVTYDDGSRESVVDSQRCKQAKGG